MSSKFPITRKQFQTYIKGRKVIRISVGSYDVTCPVAQALKAATGEVYEVGGHTYTESGVFNRKDLPKWAERFISKFDKAVDQELPRKDRISATVAAKRFA